RLVPDPDRPPPTIGAMKVNVTKTELNEVPRGRQLRLCGAAALAVVVASCSGGARSLINVQIIGDQAYQHVTLNVSATGSPPKTFADASFDQTMAVSIGLYLPSDVRGTVMLVASAMKGGCLVGQGVVNVDGVQPGATYPSTVVLPILRAGVPCIDAGSDDGGSDSAGAGGAPGAGGGPGSGGVTTGS